MAEVYSPLIFAAAHPSSLASSNGQSRDEQSGKPLISVTDGSIIATFEDVLIDPDTQQVTALVTRREDRLGHGLEAVPSERVRVWGHDVILVSRPDAVVKAGQLPDVGKWLSVSGDLKGREVAGMDGTCVGVLNDVVIDARGQVIGYDLTEVFVDGPVAWLMPLHKTDLDFLTILRSRTFPSARVLVGTGRCAVGIPRLRERVPKARASYVKVH